MKNYNTRQKVLLLISAALFNFLVYYGGRKIGGGLPHICLAMPIDHIIPLIPWTIVIYCGAYLFWIVNYSLSAVFDKSGGIRFILSHFIGEFFCFLFFVLMPTTIARPEAAGSSVFDQLLMFVYRLDSADNLMPSIHCFASWLSWIGVRNNARIPRWYQNASLLTAIAICVSTLTVKQHAIADVVVGIILAELSYFLAGYEEHISIPPLSRRYSRALIKKG